MWHDGSALLITETSVCVITVSSAVHGGCEAIDQTFGSYAKLRYYKSFFFPTAALAKLYSGLSFRRSSPSLPVCSPPYPVKEIPLSGKLRVRFPWSTSVTIHIKIFFSAFCKRVYAPPPFPLSRIPAKKNKIQSFVALTDGTVCLKKKGVLYTTHYSNGLSWNARIILFLSWNSTTLIVRAIFYPKVKFLHYWHLPFTKYADNVPENSKALLYQ